MSVMHTPETAGAQAIYKEDSGYGLVERDVLGWDKLGRPLVMCGDRLYPATEAPFAYHTEFLEVKRPDFADVVREAVWDSLRGVREEVEDLNIHRIIREVVEDVVGRRASPSAPNSTN